MLLTLKEFGLVLTLCCISIYLIYDLKKCLNLEMVMMLDLASRSMSVVKLLYRSPEFSPPQTLS